ncbi:phosphatidylserine synthase [mine drainage metagenome]|uniref:Phosphatidylserine synthase n=1 Tax=mine drainage metagenome TaxID=410659 RepID=T0YAB7_9ZZZZ
MSQIRYYSFKDFNLAKRIRYTSAVAIPLFLIVIALSPAKILFACLLAYAVSGPLFSLWRWRHRRRRVSVAP